MHDNNDLDGYSKNNDKGEINLVKLTFSGNEYTVQNLRNEENIQGVSETK